MREGGRKEGEKGKDQGKGEEGKGEELLLSKVSTYSSWVWVGEEGDVSNHLLVGKLIILCALDHSIQHQHTAKCLATKEDGEEEEEEG